VFESIKSIRPHFHSLREIEGNVSLDIKLPLNWRYEEIVKPYRSVKIKVQDKNEKFTLLSLVSSATIEGYNVIFACSQEIIDVNKEEEEKEKLFQQKVKELQEFFKKESLDTLKDISFIKEDEPETETSIGLVNEGDDQGSTGDSEPQDEDD
jgi:hypothetical protein